MTRLTDAEAIAVLHKTATDAAITRMHDHDAEMQSVRTQLAIERFAALIAERDALREDAERYRWLRSNVYPSGFFGRKGPHVVMSVYFGHDAKGNQLLMHPGKESKVGIPDLDTAIDAAMEVEHAPQQD